MNRLPTHCYLPVFLICIFLFSCKRNSTKETDPPTPPPATQQDDRFNIDATLVTPNATKEAIALYKFLKENYGKRSFRG